MYCIQKLQVTCLEYSLDNNKVTLGCGQNPFAIKAYVDCCDSIGRGIHSTLGILA